MNLYSFNETEWIAANTMQEAIDFAGFEVDEIEISREIPQEDWNMDIEFYDTNDEYELGYDIKLGALMNFATYKNEPMYIMTETN